MMDKVVLVLAYAQGCAIQLVGGTTCLLVTSSCVLALLKTKILRIKTLRRRTSPNADRVGREIILLQTWWYIIVGVGGEWVEETMICEKEGLLVIMYHLVWMPRGVPAPNLALTFVPMKHGIVPGM